MKIEKVQVFGFEASLRGMRNPMESWNRSDSSFFDPTTYPSYPLLSYKPIWETYIGNIHVPENPFIGRKDMKLAQSLIRKGSEHRKFLRQIMIWMDITIPRYVWQELDTYKIGTVRNSCSTMHTLGKRDLTMDDFQIDIAPSLLDFLNQLGRGLRELKKIKENKNSINSMRRNYKNNLPEGFLQKATYSLNYETALNMYHQRHNHRLEEWNVICCNIKYLPHMESFLSSFQGV